MVSFVKEITLKTCGATPLDSYFGNSFLINIKLRLKVYAPNTKQPLKK